MVSTFTPNIQIEEPARGDDVGTWDTPVNANMSVLDLILGGTATIPLNNSNIVLSAAQFQCQTITFNSTLTASVTITFPTSFKKPYIVQNLCTGSSAFTITLTTTAAGAQVICCPPGEAFDCLNDGSNIKFKNFGRIGSYWDYAGSSVPNWVSGCTVPPYLNCDGTSFSSATYPALNSILGSSLLPDAKGRVRAALDQGAGRVSSAVSGISGNTLLAAGGDQRMQSHNHTGAVGGSYTTPDNYNPNSQLVNGIANGAGAAFGGFPNQPSGAQITVPGNSFSVTINSNGSGASQNMQPTYMGGLTLIRAA